MQQSYDPRQVNVLSYCQSLGAHNPRITHQQDLDAQTTLFTIEADAWDTPSQFGAGNERMFTLWMDGQGSGRIGEVGLMPHG